MNWKDASSNKQFNFSCSVNWEHYRLFFVHWEPIIRIEYEKVVVYEGRHQYNIWQYEDNTTEIYIYDVDAEGRVLDPDVDTKHKFTYGKRLFDFSRSNREKIINRAKTILVFQ